MKVLQKTSMPDGTEIQIEEWNETYDFIPYASTLASYPKSKMSHEGSFAPKGNEPYRFSFRFQNEEECKVAFNKLKNGECILGDYRSAMEDKRYQDCI